MNHVLKVLIFFCWQQRPARGKTNGLIPVTALRSKYSCVSGKGESHGPCREGSLLPDSPARWQPPIPTPGQGWAALLPVHFFWKDKKESWEIIQSIPLAPQGCSLAHGYRLIAYYLPYRLSDTAVTNLRQADSLLLPCITSHAFLFPCSRGDFSEYHSWI